MLFELLSILFCSTVGYAFGWDQYLYFGISDYKLKGAERVFADWYTNPSRRCAISCAIRGAGVGIFVVGVKSIFF